MNQNRPLVLLLPTQQVEAAGQWLEAFEPLGQWQDEDGVPLSCYGPWAGTTITVAEAMPVPALVSRGIAHEFRNKIPLEAKHCERRTIRFSATGELQELYIPALGYNPPLDELMAILDTTPRAVIRQAKLEQYLRNHHASVTPLSWKNQVEYGKVYRTVQLISAQ